MCFPTTVDDIGDLFFQIMEYKHLLPLFTKRQSFYDKNWAVREHAIKVEQQERTLAVNVSFCL